MKQQLIDDIILKLNELKIPFTLKDNSYIYVNTEFYEIGNGMQSKMILYELSVFLDEPNMSVFMYVKTVEKFISADGVAGDYTNQSSSLFRKVRSVCSDEDGKISVITIDLGELPNTVKNTAFKYGWKFRTALNLNKPNKKAAVQEKITIEELEFEVPEDVCLTEPEIIPVQKHIKKAGFGSKLKKFFKH